MKKNKKLLKIERKEVEFCEVVRLYQKSKPLTKRLSIYGIKRFAKVNRLKFTPDSFVEWLGTCKLVANKTLEIEEQRKGNQLGWNDYTECSKMPIDTNLLTQSFTTIGSAGSGISEKSMQNAYELGGHH